MNEKHKNDFWEDYSLIPKPEKSESSEPQNDSPAPPQNTSPAPDDALVRSARKTYSRVALSVIVYILVSYAVSFACVFVMTAIDKRMLDTTKTDIYYWVMSIIPQYVFAVPCSILVLLGLPKAKPKKEKLSLPKLLLFFLVCFGISGIGSIMGQFVMNFVNAFTGIEFEPVVEDMLGRVSIWYNIVIVAVLAPIFEELIFRKFLIDRLGVYGQKSAIIISALLFGLLHGNLSQLFYAVFIGIILGYVYCRTGRVIYTIILHAAFNSLAGVFMTWLMSNLDLELLSSLKDSEEILEFVAKNLWYLVIFYAYELLFLAAIVAAVVLIIVFIRRTYAKLDKELLPKKTFFKAVGCNVAMIALCVVFVLQFILNLL